MKQYIFILVVTMVLCACGTGVKRTDSHTMTAQDILGNSAYPAMSYGGYRQLSRDQQPTLEQITQDMRILYAMGIRLLRTYNVHYQHASTVLEAISLLKQENPDFEMYVMLGAWIDCKDAWTDVPDHNAENEAANQREIDKAVALAQAYPDIVKIIAVGNEAMVKWAASYYVQPDVILKYVNQLQQLKQKGELPASLWITSSDNFASWGGGGTEYHVPALEQLLKAVDFVSMHTYPMHDTHYNPDFWGVTPSEAKLPLDQQVELAMNRAVKYAQNQVKSTLDYMKKCNVGKPIHIGETGWASASNGFYGPDGSHATDEYKEALYYHKIRNWTDRVGMSCFYFEAFDEIWKDAANPGGSENHFGLFDLSGNAKYALWSLVDQGRFDGLSRGGQSVGKTLDGNVNTLMKTVLLPPTKDTITIK